MQRLSAYPYPIEVRWREIVVTVFSDTTSVRVGTVWSQNIQLDGSGQRLILYLERVESLMHMASDSVVQPPPAPPPPPRPLPDSSTVVPSLPTADDDRDGIPDDEDACPRTATSARVIERGCSLEQFDDFVASLPRGVYAFNVQDTMVVEEEYVIVLVLKPRVDSQLSTSEEEMYEAVLSALEQAGSDARDTIRVESNERPFSRRMRAVLAGPESWSVRARPGFDETRLISDRDSTVWIWEVTPHACARGRSAFSLGCRDESLSLAVYAHFGEEEIPWPLMQEQIHVRVTLGQKLGGLATASIPWLLALLTIFAALLWWSNRRRVTILFLAANPHDTSRLNLDEEIRAIDAALQKGRYRNRFRIEQHWAVRATELDDFLLRHRPQIVHFSGHGSAASELILEEDTPRDIRRAQAGPRTSEAVSADSLSRVFAPLKGTVRCVVLNACYSEIQARAISQHVDCVVGMSRAIGDSAAINFASGFYLALSHGSKVGEAFQLACSEIERSALIDDDVPKLIGQNHDSLTFTRGRSPS